MDVATARPNSMQPSLETNDSAIGARRWRHDRRALAAVIVIAIVLRVALVPLYAHLPGGFNDEDFWKAWMQDIHQHGVINIFRSSDTDYVGYQWILWLLAGIYALIGGPYTPTAPSLHALVKVPAIVFDVALIVVVYEATRRLHDALVADGDAPGTMRPQPRDRVALIAAAVIAFQPAVLYDGAVWGQTDSAVAVAMLGSVVLAASRRPSLAWAAWTLGFLVKPQPVIVLPILLVVMIRSDGWRGAMRGFVAGLAVAAIVLGPWIIHGDLARIADTYHRLFTANYERLSSSAWNLWWFIDVASQPRPEDAVVAATPWLTYRLLGLMLSGMAGGLALLAAASLPPLRGALLASAYVACAFYILPISTHERYLYPFLALLLPLVVIERGWLWLYVPLSATLFLNLIVVAPPVASWSGRWVESPFSLAIAASNVALFGAFTAIMVREVLPCRTSTRRAGPRTWTGTRNRG